MKLHGTLISPFTRMCMATAIESGISMRVQLVQASVAPDAVNKQLEALSPLGKVPVLELDNGKTLYDSRVIMEFLASLSANTLLPAQGEARFAALTALALAEGLGDAAVSLRYETFFRPADKSMPALAERQRARIRAAMDGLLPLVQPEITLASVATACVLSYIDIRAILPDWRDGRAALASWHEGFAKRPSLAHTVPRL